MSVGDDYVTLKGIGTAEVELQCVKRIIILRKYREPCLAVLSGIVVMGLMAWVYVDTSSYMFGECSKLFFNSVYILMIIGCFLLSVGILGYRGAAMNNPRMLGMFSGFLPLVLLTALLASINVVIYQDEVRDNIAYSLKDKMMNEYGIDVETTSAVDVLQKKLECCGGSGIDDWAVAEFNNATTAVSGQTYRVPQSCCKAECSTPCHRSTESEEFNVKGCVDVLKDKIDDRFAIVMAVGFTLAVYQIPSFIYSLLVFCSVNGNPRCRRYHVL